MTQHEAHAFMLNLMDEQMRQIDTSTPRFVLTQAWGANDSDCFSTDVSQMRRKRRRGG